MSHTVPVPESNGFTALSNAVCSVFQPSSLSRNTMLDHSSLLSANMPGFFPERKWSRPPRTHVKLTKFTALHLRNSPFAKKAAAAGLGCQLAALRCGKWSGMRIALASERERAPVHLTFLLFLLWALSFWIRIIEWWKAPTQLRRPLVQFWSELLEG